MRLAESIMDRGLWFVGNPYNWIMAAFLRRPFSLLSRVDNLYLPCRMEIEPNQRIIVLLHILRSLYPESAMRALLILTTAISLDVMVAIIWNLNGEE